MGRAARTPQIAAHFECIRVLLNKQKQGRSRAGVYSRNQVFKRKLAERFRNWAGFQLSNEARTDLALSLAIGAVVGLVVVAFIILTGRLAARMYPPESSAWRRVLIPTAGAFVTGILLYRYFPNARGSGIPQAKFALFIQEGYISFRTVIGKFVCCSASLASGIALGREGPSVQIGAGIASVVTRGFGLNKERVKAMLPVGCSAALAAAFNTPIAAVLFSLEEILGDMHAPVLGTVVLSSATSWVVLHLILGDEPLFHVPAYQLVHPLEFGIYAALGVAGGLGSVAFVKLLLAIREFFSRLPKSTVWLQPTVGGLVVGLLGWFAPQVLGVGYDFVELVLAGNVAFGLVAVLAVLKIIATPAAYSTGNAGGIFGPSLFIGAMIGGAVGSLAHSALPQLTANPGAYALVGMGAAFAGIVRTPLTSVIMIFEMTRDYSIIVPLMIANLVSFFVSYTFQREPIYEALARQEGVFLPTAEGREESENLRVGAVMRSSHDALSPSDSIADAAARMKRAGWNAMPVVDSDGVRALATERALAAANADGRTSVGEIYPEDSHYPFVHPDHSLSLALQRMGATDVNVLPVVSRANVREMFGVVALPDVLSAYGVIRPKAKTG
jgi:CIC family chloride channel protein